MKEYKGLAEHTKCLEETTQHLEVKNHYGIINKCFHDSKNAHIVQKMEKKNKEVNFSCDKIKRKYDLDKELRNQVDLENKEREDAAKAV